MVPIAHDSAGPREDIVVEEEGGGPALGGGEPQPTGYRCTTVDQYADAIVEVLGMGQVERMRVSAAARRRAAHFSDQRFQKELLACLADVLPMCRSSCPPHNVLT